MKKVVFFGYKYFCSKLVNKLREHDNDNQYFFVDTNNFLGKMLAVYKILTSDIIFIIGGTISKSKIIDLALIFNKKVFIEWVGTDVLIARENYDMCNFNSKYIIKCQHLCEVDWIRNELRNIGINASICDIVTIDDNKEYNKRDINCDKITVLIYIAKNREEFYGIDLILKLAELYPKINFRICGTDGNNYKQLNNVLFLGWVENMEDEYDNCDIYMRLVKHDGLAFSVIEALSKGKWVIYSYPFDYVKTYKDFNELKIVFDDLLEKCYEGQLNTSAVNFILKKYNKKHVLTNFINIITRECKNRNCL